MKLMQTLACALAGFGAGAVTGLFGAGGGMVLVPLLCWLTDLDEDSIFPSSISIILPICLVSISMTAATQGLPWQRAFPYLIGSAVGGIIAGLWGRKIPTVWLHRILGVLILWGGIRYLC
ncbi:MAG: sulfite exporter TauE/SafE family protein [Clostridia bacterium]|nr:sulfite exporter TauE/SafE family protein [Oscillospiraceae bacterium]MBO7175831.1 sulfite exporter TauE/SafE family protein [Clostridia bacterium]